jgi:anti-sigma factor RsiW
MIDYKDQLRLQAYLDGELSASEAKEVSDVLAKDAESAALVTELRQTSQALAGLDDGLKLPESREFFWSKVQRGIESQENRTITMERSTPVPWSVRLRRFLVPASGLAVIAALALVVTRESGGGSTNPSVETSLADGGGVVYHDFSARATFVWLSYPPDSDSSEEDDTGSLD